LRTLVTLAVVAATTTVGVGAVDAVGAQKGSGLSVSRPCTYLTAKQVQTVFRAPVTIDLTNRGNNEFIAAGCSYVVGTIGHPAGVFVTTIVYPFFPAPGQTAIDVVEAQRAGAALDGLVIEDAKIGRTGYIDADHSMVTVAANKKFAFSLQWLATGAPPNGDKLGAKTQKQLLALAKQIVARGPK
jgi:hypothetical protein